MMEKLNVKLTVCSNLHLHSLESCIMVEEAPYHVIKMQMGELTWRFPTAEFVAEFVNELNIPVHVLISHGICPNCLEIIQQSDVLIHSVGGK